MILIAASALTLGMMRSTGWFARFQICSWFWWDTLPAMALHGRNAYSFFYSLIDEILVQASGLVLLSLTAAQILIRARMPRPSLRDAVRQAGTAASLAALPGVILLVNRLRAAQFDVAGWLSEVRQSNRTIAYPWLNRWGADGRLTLAWAGLLCWPLLGLGGSPK